MESVTADGPTTPTIASSTVRISGFFTDRVIPKAASDSSQLRSPAQNSARCLLKPSGEASASPAFFCEEVERVNHRGRVTRSEPSSRVVFDCARFSALVSRAAPEPCLDIYLDLIPRRNRIPRCGLHAQSTHPKVRPAEPRVVLDRPSCSLPLARRT